MKSINEILLGKEILVNKLEKSTNYPCNINFINFDLLIAHHENMKLFDAMNITDMIEKYNRRRARFINLLKNITIPLYFIRYCENNNELNSHINDIIDFYEIITNINKDLKFKLILISKII